MLVRTKAAACAFAVAATSCALAIAAVSFGASAASASTGTVVFTDAPGTGAPPSTLGPYQMTPFPADSQPTGTYVTSVAGPTGTLGFSPSLEHCLVGGCWATWSNGYTGDVYADTSGNLTLTLPSGTEAFYFYAEPNQFATFTITATSDDGTTSGAVPVYGEGGAEYFGFYGTGGASIASITVSATDPTGFAVGEFGISNGIDHFVVNAEAWIPFSQVVDPYLPVTVPYLVSELEAANDPNCYTPPPDEILSTYVTSTYGGDSHTAFGGGTYRLRTEISFDFNPATDTISNFMQDTVPAVGTSHRYKVYTSDGSTLDSCVEAATATPHQTAQLTASTTFELGYYGKNPLADPQSLTPALSGAITGFVGPDGTLTLDYKTTEFPSQGIQVSVNGSVVNTDVENDVSCLSPQSVLGLSGVYYIGRGLNSTESGTVVVQPTGNASESTPSPLC
jgi:hypothetical protein